MSSDWDWKYAQQNQNAAFLNSQIACAMIEAMGMAAENEHRKACGNSIAYGEEAFSDLINKYQIGHNSALDALRNGT